MTFTFEACPATKETCWTINTLCGKILSASTQGKTIPTLDCTSFDLAVVVGVPHHCQNDYKQSCEALWIGGFQTSTHSDIHPQVLVPLSVPFHTLYHPVAMLLSFLPLQCSQLNCSSLAIPSIFLWASLHSPYFPCSCFAFSCTYPILSLSYGLPSFQPHLCIALSCSAYPLSAC